MYTPKSPPKPDAKEINDYLARELDAIRESFAMSDFLRLKKRGAAPAKFFDGMVVYADGVEWDPGAGEGIYTYYGAAWHKLG